MKSIRKLINTVIVLYIFGRKFKKCNVESRTSRSIGVYILAGKNCAYLAMVAIMSFDRYAQGINYIVIDDGTLSEIQKKLFHQISKSVVVTSKKTDELIQNKIKHYSYLFKLFENTWNGRKVFYPILFRKYKKIIYFDADTLFFQSPTTILNWLDSAASHDYYLQDYYNFQAISAFEARHFINPKTKELKVNTGLFCLNLDSYWKRNSLSSLNVMLKNILAISSSRLMRDYYRRIEFAYLIYIVEQTMIWLAMDNTTVKGFQSDRYSLLNARNGIYDKKSKSLIFVHFTPDSAEKRIEYRYLALSFFIWVKNVLSFRSHILPWYLSMPIEKFFHTFIDSGKLRKKEIVYMNQLPVRLTED